MAIQHIFWSMHPKICFFTQLKSEYYDFFSLANTMDKNMNFGNFIQTRHIWYSIKILCSDIIFVKNFLTGIGNI